MTNKLDYRAIVKVGEKRWANIGQAWNVKGVSGVDKIRVELEQMPVPENGKIRFLLVPDVRKKVFEIEGVKLEVAG